MQSPRRHQSAREGRSDRLCVSAAASMPCVPVRSDIRGDEKTSVMKRFRYLTAFNPY
jgi:hypothetical protein